MFWLKSKDKNGSKINFFVVVSLLNFIVLSLFFFNFNFSSIDTVDKEVFDNNYQEAQIRSGIGNKDPFITRNPNLGDKISSPIIDGSDPSIGPDDAKVDLILFSDFDCDFCRRQYETIKDIIKDNEKKVRLIWKDYPDKDANSRSWQAGMAGRCAYEQDLFWEYYDLLSLDPKASFVDIARKADLNIRKFSNCLKDKKTADDLKDNIAEADSLRIAGVPYLFVNGKELLGEVKRSELEDMIELETK